jgi:hypothetical protein
MDNNFMVAPCRHCKECRDTQTGVQMGGKICANILRLYDQLNKLSVMKPEDWLQFDISGI